MPTPNARNLLYPPADAAAGVALRATATPTTAAPTTVYTAAANQKRVLYAVAVVFITNLALILLEVAGALPAAGDDAAAVDAVLKLIGGVIAFYLIANAWQLSSAIGGSGAAALLLLLPVVGLVYLVFLMCRTARFLRSNGVEASFLGVNSEDLRRLKRAAQSGAGAP